MIGGVGSAVAGRLPIWVGLVACLALAGTVLLRETGTVAVPMPQWRRQTSAVWARVLPLPVAAGLWEFDLGLVFTTWLTYAGPWLLAAIAFFVADVVFAAMLFSTYWAGRVLTVWLVPVVNRCGVDTDTYLADLTDRKALYRRVHVTGAAWSALVLLAMSASAGGLFW